jgi:hypothetical protein
MKTVILVIWHVFLNSDSAINDGSIQKMEFNGVIACETALSQIKEKSKYIDGVCVFK